MGSCNTIIVIKCSIFSLKSESKVIICLQVDSFCETAITGFQCMPHATSKIVHDTNNVILAFVVVIVDGGNLIGGTVIVVDVGHFIQ